MFALFVLPSRFALLGVFLLGRAEILAIRFPRARVRVEAFFGRRGSGAKGRANAIEGGKGARERKGESEAIQTSILYFAPRRRVERVYSYLWMML